MIIYIKLAKQGVKGNLDFEVKMNEEWHEFPKKNMKTAPDYNLNRWDNIR